MSALRWKLLLVIALFALPAGLIWLSAPATAQEGPAMDPGQQALTHGPVHEAFAEPASANPAPPPLVAVEPPGPIEEMPPDVKPEGNNIVWISGYWAWDDASNKYIWVSGIWRDAPPGYVWVPGYWTKGAGGNQWTPGFWNPQKVEQVSYLPEPPQSIEAGPTGPAPRADDFWVPGCYMWQETRYVWRPGYWTGVQPNWIWSPAHYVWSPSGFVFIPGHWDYVLASRGVLFAPVAFVEPIYRRPRFVYSPAVVIDANLLTVNFFVRPACCHYYFGDYYGDSFVALGYRPWFSVGVHAGYDPIFAYYRWQNRDNPRWGTTLQANFTYMQGHPEARPGRTFVGVGVGVGGGGIAVTLNTFVKTGGGGGGAPRVNFVNVSAAQRQDYAVRAAHEQSFAAERAKIETSNMDRGPIRTGVVGGGQPKSLDLRRAASASGHEFAGAAVASGGSTGAGSIGRTTGTGGSGSITGGTGTIGRTPGSGTTGATGSGSISGGAGSIGRTTGSGTTGAGAGTGTPTTNPNAFTLKNGETLKGGDTTGDKLGTLKPSTTTTKPNPNVTLPNGGKTTGSGSDPRGSRSPSDSGRSRDTCNGKKPDNSSGNGGSGSGGPNGR